MGILRKFRFLRVVPLMVILPAALLLNGGAVDAQDGLPPIGDIRDLSLEFTFSGIHDISVHSVVDNNSSVTMRNVQVRVTTDPPVTVVEDAANFVHSSDNSGGIWTFPEIAVGSKSEVNFHLASTHPRYVTVRTEIIHSLPRESAAHLDNNQAVTWIYVAPSTVELLVASAILSADVDNRSPEPEDTPVFTVTVSEINPFLGRSLRLGQANVAVRVALSEGLSFASTPNAPSGTIFTPTSTTTGVWRLGKGGFVAGTLRIPTNLTTDPSAWPPLNRRCLTAQIVDGIPPPTEMRNDLLTRSLVADLARTPTVCFAGKGIVPSDGEVVSLEYALCASPNDQSCVGEESEAVVMLVGKGTDTAEFHRPEDVVIPVDPVPRDFPYVTIGGSDWRWATGHVLISGDDLYPGVRMSRGVPRRDDAHSRRFTISDVSPKQRPGNMAIVDRYLDNNSEETFYEALNPDKNDKLVDEIGDTWINTDYEYLVLFSEPGVYKVNIGVQWTLKSGSSLMFSGTSFSETGTVTFIVGTVVDLQVHDAGLHGSLPRGQQAYTLRAESDLLNEAVGRVEVALSGVPQGARAVVSEDGGTYEPDRASCNQHNVCGGIWKIGDLESRDYRYLTGRSDGPTLTLLVDGDDLKPITATIASKRTETATVGGQTYTYGVTDPHDYNSKDVSVAVGTGRGEPAPDSLQSLRVDKHGHIAVLRWDPMEKVSRWPVSHYEIERNRRLVDFGEEGPLRRTLYVDLSSGASSSTYRVRAVSDQGVAGPWTSVDEASQQAVPTVGAPGAPGAFTATLLGQASGWVQLTWTPAPANNFPVSFYRIEGADQRSGPWSSVVANPGADATSSEFYPPVGSSRYFRIQAVNNQGTPGPWATAEAAAPPGMPENLRFASFGKSSVTLAWDPPSGDGGPRITGYQYHVMGPCGDGSEDPNCEFKPATRVSGTRATISGLNRNGIYNFMVRALSGAGASEWSHSIQTMLRPEEPQSGRVTLSRSSLTVREGSSATYRVRLSSNPTMPLWVVMHWDGSGNENLGGELPFQQFKILLPSGYDTSGVPDRCDDGMRLDWSEAYAWNAGVPITVTAAEDDSSDEEAAGRPKNAKLTILHTLNTLPHDCLGMAEADWSPDPVYDGVDGPALVVTERDND